MTPATGSPHQFRNNLTSDGASSQSTISSGWSSLPGILTRPGDCPASRGPSGPRLFCGLRQDSQKKAAPELPYAPPMGRVWEPATPISDFIPAPQNAGKAPGQSCIKRIRPSPKAPSVSAFPRPAARQRGKRRLEQYLQKQGHPSASRHLACRSDPVRKSNRPSTPNSDYKNAPPP